MCLLMVRPDFLYSLFGFNGLEIGVESGSRPSKGDLTGASELRMLERPLLYWVVIRSSGLEEESRVIFIQ